MKSKLLLFIFAAFLCSCICTKASYAITPIPKGIGVNIHFTGAPARDLDMMKAAGFTIARTDLKWNDIERTKGQYNWTAYDQLVAGLASRGIRPYFILDYNNTNYGVSDDMTGVTNSAQITGFTNFSKAAVARYKGKGIIWEVWNEPNLDIFWRPAPNATAYMNLLKSVVPAMKAADPNAIVVAPAVAFIANTFSFIETCAQQGLFGLVDAVSVHPYKDAAPESGTVDYLYDTLRSLIARYHPSNPNLPIVGGEFGFSTVWSNVRNETTQAQFLTRQLLYHDYKNIPVSIVYDFKNDGTDPGNTEHNFGVVRADYSLKPAYTEIQKLTQNLAGMKYSGKISSAASDYIYEYTNSSGAKTAAAWTTGGAHAVTIYGKSVNLTNYPVYVKNGTTTTPAPTPTPTPTPSVPAAPSSLRVTGISKGATTGLYFVNLAWVDNSNNETGFQMQQSVNSNNSFKIVATPAQNNTVMSVNIGTAPVQGTYYFKILAVNASGTSQPSNVVSTNVSTTTTPPPTSTTTDPTKLTAQMGVTASTGVYRAVVKWVDNATNETGYDVYQSALVANNFKLVSSISPFAGTGGYSTAYVIGANPPFGTYYYKVVAKFADGTTKTSNVASTVVKEYLSPAPSALTTYGTKDTVNKLVNILSWKDNSLNEQGFNVYYSTVQSGPFSKIARTDKNIIKIVHPLASSGTYYYKITSFN